MPSLLGSWLTDPVLIQASESHEEPENPDRPILKSSLPPTGESDLTAIWLIAILLALSGFCLIFDVSNVNSL